MIMRRLGFALKYLHRLAPCDILDIFCENIWLGSALIKNSNYLLKENIVIGVMLTVTHMLVAPAA